MAALKTKKINYIRMKKITKAVNEYNYGSEWRGERHFHFTKTQEQSQVEYRAL
jgi:hypothetical protein